MDIPPTVWAIPWIVFAVTLVVMIIVVVQYIKDIRPLEKKYSNERKRKLLIQRGWLVIFPQMGWLYAWNPGKDIWLIEDALPLNAVILVGIPIVLMVTVLLIAKVKYPKTKSS